jgi:death-on-curing protein
MSNNELTEILLGREIAIRFVSLADVIAMHDRSIATVGGTTGIRDRSLLESALHKPMQKCIYENDEDLFSLAASLADGISQNHAFIDGNKRAAFLSCVKFLDKNGIEFSPDVAEATDMFRRLAAHQVDADTLCEWIRATVREAEEMRQEVNSLSRQDPGG